MTDKDFLAAGLLVFQPGRQSLTTSWQALKDWLRRVPSRSRWPLARLVWSNVIGELFRQKQEHMGTHVLVMIALYCRPEELLTVRRGVLTRPMHSVDLNGWVLLHSIDRGVPSRTAEFGDTLADRLSQIHADLSHEQLVFLTATDTGPEGLNFGTLFVGELQMNVPSLSVSLPTSSAGKARSAWQSRRAA